MRATALKQAERKMRSATPLKVVKKVKLKADPFYNLNKESRLAVQEARDIIAGRIESKGYSSVDELMKDLLSDVDD